MATPRMIFVNLAVADVARSTAFYEAIGAVRNAQLSDPDGAFMAFSEAINIVLLSHGKFAGFTPRPIADARGASAVLLSLSAESRTAVDEIVDRAAGAGGTRDPSPIDDHGFMYGRSFEDPDGHMWGVAWMDVEAAMRAMSGTPGGLGPTTA